MATQPKKPTTRAVNGEILDYGLANYQDNPENNMSYFVDIKQDNGQVFKLWGVKLEEVMENNGFKKGDKVNLIDHGLQNNVRRWEGQYYEELKEINSIEKDDEGIVLGKETPRQLNTNADLSNSDNKERKEYQSVNHKVDDEEITDEQEYFAKLPPSVKHNYEAIKVNKFLKTEKVNYYDKTNPSSIAFEDRNTSLNTANSDEKTVNAMLDMAQAKGWKSIKLKGTEEFKHQMWLEAQLRGIETKGYKPKEEDLAAFKVKQAERTKNEIEQDVASEKDMVINTPEPDKEQALAKPIPTAEIESQGQEVERELNTELDTGNEQTPPVLDTQEQEQTQAKAYQAVIVTQEFDQGTRSSWVEVREAGTLGIGSYQEDGRAVINTPYSKENALELGVARYRIDEIESMLERGDIEPYKEVVFERSPEEQAALEQESALMQAKIAEQKAIQKEWDDRHFNNLPLEQREAILDELQSDIEKQGIGWKIAEFEGSRERYDGTLDSFHQADWVREHIEAKELEKESYIRSEEFDNGRDLGDDDVTLKADVERFGDNLAVPASKKESRESARQKVEAAFERKVDKTDQRQHQREQLTGKDAVAVAGYKKMIAEKLKDNPELMVAKLNDVDKAIASQKEFKAPEMPSNKIESSVEIQKTQPSNQDRNR